MKTAAKITRSAEVTPPIVNRVLRTPGTPLDPSTRAIMEPYFGHNFGNVRVHSGQDAAASARAINASAYTVGTDIVLASPANNKLMAHELAHVVQQQGSSERSHLTVGPSSSPAERQADRAAKLFGMPSNGSLSLGTAPQQLQRAPWGAEYGAKDEDQTKALKQGIGEIKPTTKLDPMGTPAADEIPAGTLEEIYPLIKSDLAKGKVTADTVERYRQYLNKAFRTMKIDTVEAQANFLAHATQESGEFRAFTESQGEAQHWEQDPTKIKLTESALPKDKDVNPRGKFEFIGRGAVQVTHEGGYLKVIAELEKTAEQYQMAAKKGDAKAAELAALAQEAADAIKANPQNAANPKYAFIVSAALMKNMQGDRKASQNTPKKEWTGGDSPSGWVGGVAQAKDSPQGKALVKKRDAYNEIYRVLLRQAKAAGKPVPSARMKGWGA